MKKSAVKITGDSILTPAVLTLFEQRHDTDEIARRVDKRPLRELELQVEDAMKQILVRSHAGVDKALALYFIITRQAVMSFDNLVKHELERTRAVAEQSSNLPVLLSLNPQDIKAAKERMRLLNVGAKAALPTRSGQRTDRRNHWTRLAIYAFNACLENSQRVPQIEAQLKYAKQKRVKRKFWNMVETGIEHTLPNGARTVITDWQRECVKLAGQITTDNFDRWQGVIKMCVLEFWNRSKSNYEMALKSVGAPGDIESQRRHLALNRTLQAFKSLFHPR